MKPKSALALSLILNLIMAGWIVRSLGPHPEPPTAAQVVSTRPESNSPGGRDNAVAKVPQRPENAFGHEPFGWRQVESEDYRQYLANLRAIGCPEKTIKDIVVADVSDLFASRAATLTQTNQYRYWRNEPMSRTEEQERQLRDLWAQKRDVLRSLGFDAPDFTNLAADMFRDRIQEFDLQISFLPEPKRQQTKETLFKAAQQTWNDGADVSQHGAIEQEALTQIQSLLTPEEFHEYELRSSMDAQILRGTLDSLALTEQEFRVIFDSWRDLKAIGSGTPEHRQLQETSELALQRLLGPDRFLRYLDGVRQWGYPH